MKVIKALKEVAPESKVVVSKTIPIGDQKLDIERNVFNASIAKELSEDSEVNVSFLDHGNLAEQALPIKNYYRQDLVHLAPDGIDVFSTNLRRMINEVLKKNVGQDENNQRKDINNNSNFSGRSNVYHYRDDNRDSNSKGSTGHQESHYGNRKDYQHREYNWDSNWRNSNRNTYPGSNNGYPYRGEYRGNKNISHRNTYTGNLDNNHTYRDDEKGHYENSGHRTFTGNRDDNRLWGVKRGTYENSGHCTLTGKRDDYQFRDDERGHYESSGHHTFTGNRDDYRFRDNESGHYDNSGRRTFTGNRGGYQHRDNERGHYENSRHRNTFPEICDGYQNRDNEKYPSDNYHSGAIYSERERRYNEKRRYDWFEDDY